MNNVTPEKVNEMQEEVASEREVAKRLGITRYQVRKMLAEHKDDSAERREAENVTIMRLKNQLSEVKKELTIARKHRMSNEDVKEYVLGISKAQMRDEAYEVMEHTSTKKNTSIIPHLMISDLHYEEVVDPRQVRGLNEYTPEIAEARVETLVRNFIHITKDKFNHGTYDCVYLHLIGDLISGNIHDELAETNALAPLEASIRVQQCMIKVINTLKREFKKVYLIGSYGNHSRLQRKVRFKSAAYNNLDWQINAQLQLFFANDPDVNIVVADSHEIPVRVYDMTYLQSHGDQFRGGAGFIGSLAPIARGEHKTRIAAQSYGEIYNKLLIGHFHQAMHLPRAIVNGSVIGYNEFAMTNNFSYEIPQQVMFFTDKDLGCVSVNNVFCE